MIFYEFPFNYNDYHAYLLLDIFQPLLKEIYSSYYTIIEQLYDGSKQIGTIFFEFPCDIFATTNDTLTRSVCDVQE